MGVGMQVQSLSSSSKAHQHRDIPIYLDQHLHVVKEEDEPPTPKMQFPAREQGQEPAHGHARPKLVTLMSGGKKKLPGFVSGSALSPPNTGDHLQLGTEPGTLHSHLQQDGAASSTHNPSSLAMFFSSSWRTPYLNRPLPPPPPPRNNSNSKPRTNPGPVDYSSLSSSSTAISSSSSPFPGPAATTSHLQLVSSLSSSSSSSSLSTSTSSSTSTATTQGDHYIIHSETKTADTTYTPADIPATDSYYTTPETHPPRADAHLIDAKSGTAASEGPYSHIADISPVTAFPLPPGTKAFARTSTLNMLDRPSTSGGLTKKKSFMVSDYYSTLPNNNSSITVATAMSKADKRQSKDDLFLVAKPSLLSRFQSFRSPSRGRLPTPDPSPRSESPMSAEVPIVVRLHTPDSLQAPPRRQGTMQSEEGIGLAVGSPIGMALGSPSHPQTEAWEDPWNSQPFRQPSPMIQPHEQPQFQLPDMSSPAMSSASTEISSPQPAQPKRGKWKMFGMFGSKKHKGDSKKGRDQQQVQQQIIGSSASIGPYATGAVPARSQTLADRKAPRYKPIVVRSNTISDGSGSGSSTEAWNPPPMPQATLQVPGMNSSTTTLRTTGGRMLDVNIPSVHMERYSVMFSNVLGPPSQANQQLPPSQPSQPGSASSLLARRQATLEKLKNISDRVEQEIDESRGAAMPQPVKVARKPVPAPAPAPIQTTRRATSPVPQPSKSPAFSLFPATPSSRPKNPNTPKETPDSGNSRSRSNTAPSILPSPAKESFDLGALRKEASNNSTLSLAIPNSNPSPVSTRGRINEFPLPRSATRSQTTTTAMMTPPITIASNAKANASSLSVASKFAPDQSSLILDSPASMTSTASPEAFDIVQAGPLKPTINDPQWTMVSAADSSAGSVASTASTVVAGSRKRSPSTSSSARTHMTQPSVVSIDEDDNMLKAAVEISIARQISISRQQRDHLLRPLKANIVGGGIRRYNTVAGTSSPGKSPAGVVLEHNEKLSETNKSTPMVVHPEERLDVQVKGHQYKKSEKIVIEGY